MDWDRDSIEEVCRTMIPGYNPWHGADGLTFDHDAALRIVHFFAECLTFTVGRWASSPFVLQPWQAAIVANLWGWRRPDGTRRYRKCLLFTARKSGKTELAAGIANALLFIDGEPSPEIVSAAGNADQATKIFNAAAAMVRAEPELSSRARLFKRSIECVANSGVYKVINAAAKTKHGGNLHAALIDELHVIDDPELVDVLETSMRARRQPLVLYTTTAGDNPESIAGEVYDYAVKVRDRIIDDAEFLPVIYEVPANKDVTKPENWPLAQPNLGVTVPVSEYERDLKKALEVPRYMHVFKQLSCNQWVEAASAWLSIEDWRACGGDVAPAKKARAFGGLDLSSTTDTTAFVLAIPDGDRVLLRPWIFIPKDNAAGRLRRQKRDKAPYLSWIEQGHIIATEGNAVDYEAVEKVILENAEIHDIGEIQMDPHNASGLAERLIKAGLKVTSVRQGWSLNEATKETERLVLTRKLVHPDNPAFTWQVSNAATKTDPRDNVWLDKQRSYSRIDAAVAMVMAVNSARFGAGREAKQETTNYELVALDW